jgi:hypothetical protein
MLDYGFQIDNLNDVKNGIIFGFAIICEEFKEILSDFSMIKILTMKKQLYIGDKPFSTMLFHHY